jgi:protein-S-isoprenylcysteine O-methyltransferase Ste14
MARRRMMNTSAQAPARPGSTVSASTPRLRLTLVWYLLLLVATAVRVAPPLPAVARVALDSAALLLVTFAVLGRIWCSQFIAGRKDAELVTAGPYALCRHPLYLLSLAGGLGLGLATHSLLLTGGTLVVLYVLFASAMRNEDAFLASRHGAAFSEYAARTPRLWPGFRPQPVPATLETRPPVLWKAFVDAGAFMLLFALIVAARTLREWGVWAALFDFP